MPFIRDTGNEPWQVGRATPPFLLTHMWNSAVETAKHIYFDASFFPFWCASLRVVSSKMKTNKWKKTSLAVKEFEQHTRADVNRKRVNIYIYIYIHWRTCAKACQARSEGQCQRGQHLVYSLLIFRVHVFFFSFGGGGQSRRLTIHFFFRMPSFLLPFLSLPG